MRGGFSPPAAIGIPPPEQGVYIVRGRFAACGPMSPLPGAQGPPDLESQPMGPWPAAEDAVLPDNTTQEVLARLLHKATPASARGGETVSRDWRCGQNRQPRKRRRAVLDTARGCERPRWGNSEQRLALWSKPAAARAAEGGFGHRKRVRAPAVREAASRDWRCGQNRQPRKRRRAVLGTARGLRGRTPAVSRETRKACGYPWIPQI